MSSLFLHLNHNKNMKTFTKGLYFLLSGEIDLLDALEIIEQNYEHDFKNKIIKLRYFLKKGTNLSVAFKAIEEDEEFLNLIQICEETGDLKEVFKNLYEKYEFNENMKKELINLSIYPITIIFTTILVMFFMLKLVVPKFIALYDDLNQELPRITQYIFNLSKLINNYFLIICLSFILLCYLLIKYVCKDQNILGFWVIKLPILGKLYKQILLLRFTQNMHALLISGIEFVHALKIASKVKNKQLRQEIKKIIYLIESGKSIQEAFNNLSFFDIEYKGYLNIGSKTGNLKLSFLNLRNVYYERVQENMKRFLKILEPLSIIFISIIIGFIVFSIVLPIFNIGEIF